MEIQSIIDNLNFILDKTELAELKKNNQKIIDLLKAEIKRRGIKADVFIGGSFAKGTMTKDKGYDIDIFTRFDPVYSDISGILEGLLKRISFFIIIL